MTRHETLRPKIPMLHFAPEGYVSSSDIEYLDQLLDFLRNNNIDPAGLVFSGFDGQAASQNQALARHNGIYIMNEAGWRSVVGTKSETANPAEYAERYVESGVPCVGLYDRNLLTQIYSHNAPPHPGNVIDDDSDWGQVRYGGLKATSDEPGESGEQFFDQAPQTEYVEQREEFTGIVLGKPLSDIPASEPIEMMAVAHKDYPHNPDVSPTDALVGIVFLDEPTIDNSSGFDL